MIHTVHSDVAALVSGSNDRSQKFSTMGGGGMLNFWVVSYFQKTKFQYFYTHRFAEVTIELKSLFQNFYVFNSNPPPKWANESISVLLCDNDAVLLSMMEVGLRRSF